MSESYTTEMNFKLRLGFNPQMEVDERQKHIMVQVFKAMLEQEREDLEVVLQEMVSKKFNSFLELLKHGNEQVKILEEMRGEL